MFIFHVYYDSFYIIVATVQRLYTCMCIIFATVPIVLYYQLKEWKEIFQLTHPFHYWSVQVWWPSNSVSVAILYHTFLKTNCMKVFWTVCYAKHHKIPLFFSFYLHIKLNEWHVSTRGPYQTPTVKSCTKIKTRLE